MTNSFNAAFIAVQAAADAARRAESPRARPEQAATLLKASGYWSILADLILRGARLPKAWVRSHCLQADLLAARALELAPAAHEDVIVAALYTPAE
ncbi:hypothetical protein ACFPC0_10610 [Streptomyces andamanensis]|uniref:Uncharacterized protein n=1 Tax=Streptomyces andamanensis TaxID=1565035 RepID=A0ABV8TCA9_9ACTN